MANDDNALKQGADTIKATVDAINAVASLLSSDRTVVIEVNNFTTANLTLGPTTHKHGGFGLLPPLNIPPRQTALFGSQGSGILTGTEGEISFNIDGIDTFTVKWDVPFTGNNSCDDTVEGARRNRYVSFSMAGNGNHAQMRFMIGNRSIPYSITQILKGEADLSRGLRQFFKTPLPSTTSVRDFLKV
jgi:hypothetical protein